MYIESELFKNIKAKENFSSIDSWDAEIYLLVILYFLWLVLWVITIVDAIKLAKIKKTKLPGTGLIVSILSWPFYWLFKLTNATG